MELKMILQIHIAQLHIVPRKLICNFYKRLSLLEKLPKLLFTLRTTN